MILIITALSASVLGLLNIKLAFDVIKLRRKHGVSLGDGDHKDLNHAIRAHANLIEYAPMALILIGCLELNRAPAWLVAVLAFVFVIGRILHSIGMKKDDIPWSPRVKGMQLTLAAIAFLCLSNLFWVVFKGLT